MICEYSRGKGEKREKIVLWGAGIRGKEIVRHRDLILEIAEIVAVIDSSEMKQGKQLENYCILVPRDIVELSFDKVIVTPDAYFSEIKNQLIMEFRILPEQIENSLYFAKKKLQLRYQHSTDKEVLQILNYLETNPLNVFCYSFAENYKSMEPDIHYDKSVGMYYVVHKDRPLYMAKYLNTADKVKHYYRSICMEQDKESPHAYLDDNFQVENGDIVLDVGVAEGNFSLEVIDRASKVYLVEADKEWVSALKCTFSGFGEKVVVINAFVSDFTAFNMAALDDLLNESVNFIKMDIEGSEIEALLGAQKLINDSPKLKCAICAYHSNEDEMMIKQVLNNYGMSCKSTEGYMFFPEGMRQRFISPKLRRGIVKARKN